MATEDIEAGGNGEDNDDNDTHGQKRRLGIKDGSHNHDATTDPAAHRIIRSFDKTEAWKESIGNDRKNGIRARQTYTVQYAENPGIHINMSDIYNQRQADGHEELGNRPPIHALLFSLTTGERAKNWKCYYQTLDSEEGLMIMHMKHRKLLTQNPDVVIADCTYKTNRFNMPLLNLVGMTPTTKSFFAASCFLPGEHDDHFE